MLGSVNTMLLTYYLNTEEPVGLLKTQVNLIVTNVSKLHINTYHFLSFSLLKSITQLNYFKILIGTLKCLDFLFYI